MEKSLENQLSITADGGFISLYDHQSEISIYTAVKTYKSRKKNFEVKLAGEIHHGEESYFRSIEEELKTLDKILCEGITPSRLSLKDMLHPSHLFFKSADLEFLTFEKVTKLKFAQYQLDSRWEYCDITIKEYIDDLKKQKASAECLKAIPAQLLLSLFNLITPPEELKKETIISIVKQTIQDDLQDENVFDSTEIVLRNKKVIKRLNEIYENSSDYKMGVVYGAGHMLDFEGHVTKNLCCEKTQEKWLKVFSAKK